MTAIFTIYPTSCFANNTDLEKIITISSNNIESGLVVENVSSTPYEELEGYGISEKRNIMLDEDLYAECAPTTVTISDQSIIKYANEHNGKTNADYAGMCLQYVFYVYKQLGASDAKIGVQCNCAYEAGDALISSTSKENIPIGSLVFFDGPSKQAICSACGNHRGHVGIYVGENQGVLSIHDNGSIKIESISDWESWGYAYRGWGNGKYVDVSQSYSMKTIDGASVSTTAVSPQQLNVIVFGRPECINTTRTLKGISESSWVSAQNIKFIYADVDGNDQKRISEFAQKYSSNITFCYGDNNSIAWKLYGKMQGGSLPFIHFVSDSGIVNKTTFGYQSPDNMYDEMVEILGDDAPEPDRPPTYTVQTLSSNKSLEARSMLSMINDFRVGNDTWYWNSDNKTKTVCSGLQPLTYDYELEKVAIERAKEITVYYSHDRPNGEEYYRAYPRKKYTICGENISYGQSTAAIAFKRFREDEYNYDGQAHRRNMLSGDYNAVGLACFECEGIKYWVQEFGYRNTFSEKELTPTQYSDETKKYDINVSEDILKPYTIEYDKEINLDINQSKNKDLSLYFISDYENTNTHLYLPTTIRIENPSILTIEGLRLTGLKAGKTTVYLSAKTGIESVFSGKIKVNVNLPQINMNSVKNKKGKKVIVKWGENTGFSGYEVQYSLGKKFPKGKKTKTKTVKSAKKTSLTIKKLQKGKTYYVRVRAYTLDGTKKVYGKWSKAKKVKIKK